MAIDIDTQRLNMVESQVRTNDVTDLRIISAMMEVARDNFVPGSARPLAYMEGELIVTPEEDGEAPRALLAPMVLAKLIQLANINEDDLVLDIGCATGYSSAILAHLANAVVGLEKSASLVKKATSNLSAAGIDNAAIIEGPLDEGYASEGPYDVIFLNGRVPEAPEKLLAQLKSGGRLVGVMGDGVTGKATIWLRQGDSWTDREVFDADASDLPGFEKAPIFNF